MFETNMKCNNCVAESCGKKTEPCKEIVPTSTKVADTELMSKEGKEEPSTHGFGQQYVKIHNTHVDWNSGNAKSRSGKPSQ
jgi:hypothetical protein